VRGAREAQPPLLRFEPPAVDEKVLFYAQNVPNSPPPLTPPSPETPA